MPVYFPSGGIMVEWFLVKNNGFRAFVAGKHCKYQCLKRFLDQIHPPTATCSKNTPRVSSTKWRGLGTVLRHQNVEILLAYLVGSLAGSTSCRRDFLMVIWECFFCETSVTLFGTTGATSNILVASPIRITVALQNVAAARTAPRRPCSGIRSFIA